MLDRIFVRPHFNLHYRLAPLVRWAGEAHSDYLALVQLEGAMRIDVNESKTELAAGAALLLNPGQAASGIAKTSAYLSVGLSSSLLFDCALRSRLVTSGARIELRGPVVADSERLNQLASDIAVELESAEAGQELVLAAMVEQVAIHLLRHHANVQRSDEMELSRAGLVDRRIRRAVELMHIKLAEDLSLGEIAAAAYLSPFHFARLFKKITGSAPHAYLAALRASRAQVLLADTDLSITEIASQVGYSSSSHFSKAFRTATGLTPRAFRTALVS